MSDFYSKEDLKNSTFLPYPSEFVFNPVLRAIPAQAKELYAVLRYRINLSARNNDFCDEKGLFVLYNQKELEEQTGMAERTIKYWFSLARKNFLIETVRQAPGLPSLPMRERGLKCLRRFDEITNRVAPHAGAWIEI